MEFRVLQYFLAIAREQSISGAAEFLHISQPTLSRQIHDMEEELGKQLFIRGNRRITLTEEGMLLRKRAEEIVTLMRKTESEIMNEDKDISGDIYIGAGESDTIQYVAKTIHQLHERFPMIRYHISSDDAVDILDQLDKGLIDFGIVLGHVDRVKYEGIPLPGNVCWGVIMRKDDPLAQKENITVDDLRDASIILSRQVTENHPLYDWFQNTLRRSNVVLTYNLLYNASLMVAEGIGYAISLDKLINTTGDSVLTFRPLAPALDMHFCIIWKKYQTFSKASKAFLETLKRVLQDQEMDTDAS